MLLIVAGLQQKYITTVFSKEVKSIACEINLPRWLVKYPFGFMAC